MSGGNYFKQTNHIRADDEVWSAIFYLNLPTDADLPKTLEQWYGAKYIIYKSYMGNHGENLMGYIQFKRKMSGTQLAMIHPGVVWKHQQRSNFSCIRYIREQFSDKVCRPVVELGEHWPFRTAPVQIYPLPASADAPEVPPTPSSVVVSFGTFEPCEKK
jgi:hypothetical protein